MIAIKVNDNMNNLKIDNFNIEYSFNFYINMYFRKNYKCDSPNNPPIHAFSLFTSFMEDCCIYSHKNG